MDWLDSAPHTLLTDSHWLHRPLTRSAYRPPANDTSSSVAARPTVRPPPHPWYWNIPSTSRATERRRCPVDAAIVKPGPH